MCTHRVQGARLVSVLTTATAKWWKRSDDAQKRLNEDKEVKAVTGKCSRNSEGVRSSSGGGRELVWRSQYLNSAWREEGIWETQKREKGGGHSRLT